MMFIVFNTDALIQDLYDKLEACIEIAVLEPTTRDDYLKHDPARFFLHPSVRTALLLAKPMTRPTHRPCCRSFLPSTGFVTSSDDLLGH